MVFNEACRQLTRDILLACNGRNRCAIDQRVRDCISRLRLHRRGCRAGNHCHRRVDAAQRRTVSTDIRPWEIPTVISNRLPSNVNTGQLFHGHRDVRTTAIKTVQRRCRGDTMRLGLLNARSVSDKSAAIQQWISDMKLGIAALVETWHDDAASPQLIACVPNGFRYVEKARPRKDMLSTSTNHGGVCLLYEPSLHARAVQLPVY